MEQLNLGDDERFFNMVLIATGLCIFLGHMTFFMLFRPPKLLLEVPNRNTVPKSKSE